MLLVVLTCACSDAVLVSVGVGGFARIGEALPWFGTLMRYGGAAFLFIYGLLAFKSALTSDEAIELAKGNAADEPWRPVFLTCLALTWLNPHVYLDTIVLLGSIASQMNDGRFAFGLGAVTASFFFFFVLGYGARLLAPIFTNPRAWRILDVIIGCIMWAIALQLLVFYG